MTVTASVVGLPSAKPARRERWLALRDFLGGAFLLATWLALWTVTWAAVAGPLRPIDPQRPEAPAEVAGLAR
jgi:hypothetical protein